MHEGLQRFSLGGARVLVCGAGRGLGRGLAVAAASAGAEVVGVSRSAKGLAETEALVRDAGGSFTACPADLSQLDSLDEVVAAATSAGPINGVVHAAGIQIRKPAMDVTIDDWDAVTRIHLTAPFFLSTKLARLQEAAAVTASHVFVGSLTSFLGVPNIAPYAAAKSGLLGAVRTLAVEWADRGIRVNALAPGYFHTDLTDELFKDEESAARIRGRIPMGRLGVADDLAGAMIFLLSPASSYVTGQVITVDGGWRAG